MVSNPNKTITVQGNSAVPIEVGLGVTAFLLAIVLMLWAMLSPEMSLLLLALFLLLVPVLGLSVINSMRHPSPSMGIYLFVFTFCMVDFSLKQQSGGLGIDLQSLIKGGIYFVVLVFCIFQGYRNQFASLSLKLLFLYSAFSTLTVSYSTSPLLGIGAGIALFAISASGATISTWPAEQIFRIWRVLFAGIALMAIASLAMYLFMPARAIATVVSGQGRLQGVTGSPNSLGPIMGIGVVVGIYFIVTAETLNRKLLFATGTLLVLITLYLTNSKAAMIGAALGCLVSISLSNTVLILMASLLALTALGVFLYPSFYTSALGIITDLISRTGSIDEITSFTGRDEIWRFVYGKWLEQPWFGYGLGSARVVIFEGWADQWGNRATSAHNFLLESLLSVGLLGTLLLLAFICLLLAGLLKQRALPAGISNDEQHVKRLLTMMFACLLVAIVDGLMEKGFAGIPSPATVLFGIIAGSYTGLTKKAV